MKIARIASLATVILAAASTACVVKAQDDDNLSSTESALVADNDEASDVDESAEVGIEESLSGGQPSDPSAPADPATPDTNVEQVAKTNPGLFFKPQGCITSTFDAGTKTATHVFNNCTGPAGLTGFNGTVTSKWERLSATEIQVTHAATDFKLTRESKSLTLSGSAKIKWSKSGTLYTKTRDASWTGKTGAAKDFNRVVKNTVTYDTGSKCITRDGSATTTLGGREFTASIAGYKRCGIGSFGCPQSGKITLTGSGPNGSATLTIEFTGGRGYKVVRPNGKTITGNMIFCRVT